MKAESEVSISCAISIFSNEKFTPDDDRLNYQSYKELGLICGQCRELIFFKKGTERVSHFSHFKTTGKDCQWRTGSDSNTLHTDAEGREQSLEKFQTKFKSIIEEGIIKHQQISSSQLREQIKEGQRLVSTYKIDIDSWLRWFNQNRKPLRNLAKSLYQTNELVSEQNQIILLNFVDYLCVPASEYILRDILYYVFGLLDKEISLKKYLEELPSKVIELMSYAEWEKEYKRAKEGENFSSDLVLVKSTPDTEVAPTKPTVKSPATSVHKAIDLIGVKSIATNSLEWRGLLGNVPCKVTLVNSHDHWFTTSPSAFLEDTETCKVTLVNSHDHWEIVALPIKDIPVFPLLYVLAEKYLSGYWQENEVDQFLIHPLDREVQRLDDLAAKCQDPDKIEAIGRREVSLGRLRHAILQGKKDLLEADKLAQCKKIVQKAISEADHKTSDAYYILGQVFFVSKKEDSINYLLDDSHRNVFEQFLRTKDGRFVAEAQNQLRHLVNVFLSRNFNTLVGENRVGQQRKVSEIIGFERSKSGWSEIKGGFVKHLTPYSSDSAVIAGKLVYLATNKVLSTQDLEHLIMQVAENWSKWHRKDQPQIKIGNSFGKNTDPQSLIWVLTKKILSGDSEEDKDAWQDTINWFAEVCKFSNEYQAIGFRCNNGVILTPDCIYHSHIDKWMHRIKVQLIDLLLDSDAGNIEAWLQKSPEYLYEALEMVRPNWDSNRDITKHLEAMHDALNICLEVEESKNSC